MAELLVRYGAGDEALLERMLSGAAAGGVVAAPDRVVLDAHVALARPRFAQAARRSGVPLLVDPQTHYLQDLQHDADPWALLPFGRSAAHTPSDLTSAARQEQLVETCIDYQLQSGATAVIPPYLHVERENDGWVEVQVALWRRTREYLDELGLELPVVGVMAVGWRLLDRVRWGGGVDRLLGALADLQPHEVALAASKVDQGARPDERLVGLIATIRHIRHSFPVVAWQQGCLGEAAVAAGAVGYETGLGWRERCDLRTAMGQHRQPPASGGFGARPVYVPALRRSIPKRSLQALLGTRFAAQLLCMDYQCCPGGPSSMLGDARAHALVSRARSLADLDRISRHAWRWRHLSDVAAQGLALADRINATVGARAGVTRVDTAALRSLQLVANNRRQTLGRRRAA